jgi:hopanoid C-2 methylase
MSVTAAPPAVAVVSLDSVQSSPRREAFVPRTRRNILCVFPRYTHSFGTFDHAFPLVGVRAFMPPQGILVIAAYLPDEWNVRFIDENLTPATDADFAWADAVFLSGMHVQRDHLRDIAARAHAHNKLAILGGPSVSACPEWYSEMDILHCGELGDATDAILRRLDESCERPPVQEIYTTEERLPLSEFPLPAYHLLDMQTYFLGSIQFSSGCPFRCEFCDIPELYGRNPRLKTPQRVTEELDAMLERGNPGAVYFVDDNFFGNPKAAVSLVQELIRWQNERGYPLQFACEATLNISKNTELLEMMREAYFTTVFVGIETPEENALKFINKTQNLRTPLADSVKVINSYGMEVVSGIIIGFDTDTENTADRIVEFIESTQIPMLTINMLHALPKTPLWRRLEAENRIVNIPGRESNVEYKMPYEQVVEGWLSCIRRVYTPEAIYRRFAYQMVHTFPNRKVLPNSKARLNAKSVLRGAKIMSRIMWHCGVRADYRREFWKMALPALKQLRIEHLIQVAVVSHHTVMFARECISGQAEKCFYSPAASEPASATA